jgi:uncharacterized protein YigA (DUF484 family)
MSDNKPDDMIDATPEVGAANAASFEDQVLDYLLAQPDLLDRNPDVLSQLHLPHASGSGTVSLLERQNQSLRKQLDAGRKQLNDLIGVARENDALNSRLHSLTLTLIEADSLDTLLLTLIDDLREQFSADAVEIKLFAVDALEQAVNQGKSGPLLFEDFMQAGKPRCGALKQEQMHYLFRDQGPHDGSVAIVPLRHKQIEGILAIGSQDKQRFHPGKDTAFLQRLGELISFALSRFSLSGAQ